MQQSVDRKNEGLANFEKIKRFSLLKKDFSIEANELTPTFKVKRKLVTEKYKEVLDGLYPKEDLEIQ
ncbi:MAG: Long-chain-fatty-acid--CoA ligase FadD15 [bacterium ADurb.Bin425]|nr:MAG: Long-chain-fatty-acid--CoA ligase FadD15 [bacterium ADurb.Bin425]